MHLNNFQTMLQLLTVITAKSMTIPTNEREINSIILHVKYRLVCSAVMDIFNSLFNVNILKKVCRKLLKLGRYVTQRLKFMCAKCNLNLIKNLHFFHMYFYGWHFLGSRCIIFDLRIYKPCHGSNLECNRFEIVVI